MTGDVENVGNVAGAGGVGGVGDSAGRRDAAAGEAQSVQEAVLRADIATRRADLARTVEALAAKTHVSARAQDAARGVAVGARDRLAGLPSQVRAGALGLWHRGLAVVPPVRRQLTGAVGRATSALPGRRPSR